MPIDTHTHTSIHTHTNISIKTHHTCNFPSTYTISVLKLTTPATHKYHSHQPQKINTITHNMYIQ